MGRLTIDRQILPIQISATLFSFVSGEWSLDHRPFLVVRDYLPHSTVFAGRTREISASVLRRHDYFPRLCASFRSLAIRRARSSVRFLHPSTKIGAKSPISSTTHQRLRSRSANSEERRFVRNPHIPLFLTGIGIAEKGPSLDSVIVSLPR